MRLTPAAWSSATVNDLPLMPAMKLTGFFTAAHTARTEARSGGDESEREGHPLPGPARGAERISDSEAERARRLGGRGHALGGERDVVERPVLVASGSLLGERVHEV